MILAHRKESKEINQFERLFAFVISDLQQRSTTAASMPLGRSPSLGQGVHEDHRPFVWTKTADHIPRSSDGNSHALPAQDTRSWRG